MKTETWGRRLGFVVLAVLFTALYNGESTVIHWGWESWLVKAGVMYLLIWAMYEVGRIEEKQTQMK